MKRSMVLPLVILLGFVYTVAHYLLQTGYLNFGMFGLLLLVYFFWIMVVGLPALAAFAFQCFACNTTTNLFLRLIPTIAVVALLVAECLRPLYGLLLFIPSGFLGISRWLAVPIVLAGLLAGWLIKPERSENP